MRTLFGFGLAVASLGLSVLACGSSDGSSDGSSGNNTSGGASSGGANGSSGANGASSGNGSSGNGSSGGAQQGLPYDFRYGINLGHRNGAWGDDQEALLASRAGARSIRVKLPASHLARWGYDIEVGDNRSYQSYGMRDHIGFLIGSETIDKSHAPDGSAEWLNEHYIPKNLYEPILLADGSVNPNNYWASYVFQTVSTYKEWIKVWHVWNEPDWVADWNVTTRWNEEPPLAADLPRFNGSIFDYIRMLRISKEVAKKADPNALIATGGIGYPSFLAALLRYTDDPAGGAVSADYPAKGGAYFDVIDFHYYPIFSPKSSDASVDGFLALKAEMQATLDAAGVGARGWNASESGAPHRETPGYPGIGRPAYARNYLVKLMTLAQANGVGGIDWFILSDGASDDTDVFAHMGLYEDLAPLGSPDQAQQTETGQAYATLTRALEGARYDASATAALALPASSRGVAFTNDGKRRIVVWAKAEGAEEASATITVTSATGFVAYEWNGASRAIAAGAQELSLGSSPLVLVEP